MTLREWLASPLVAVLERELAVERQARADERAFWARVVAKAEHRADSAEGYARSLAEAVLEKRAGVRPVSLPPRPRREEPSEPEGYVALPDAEARFQALEAEGKLDFSTGEARFVEGRA